MTGAATGIGAAIAARLAREGASVVIDYVGAPGRAKEGATRVVREGGAAVALAADMADEAQVAGLVAASVGRFGRLDILGNNAGIEEQHPFLEMPRALWDRVLAVDLTGPWLCS